MKKNGMKKALLFLMLIAAGTAFSNLSARHKMHVREAKAAEASSGPAASKQDMIEVKEKMFIARINDIYLNPEDYLGKTIRYEGTVVSFHWAETNADYCYVLRYGPGCCGADGAAGFMVDWDGSRPNNGDWVEVTGVLESLEEGDTKSLILNVSSLKVLPVRGKEFVFQ